MRKGGREEGGWVCDRWVERRCEKEEAKRWEEGGREGGGKEARREMEVCEQGK